MAPTAEKNIAKKPFEALSVSGKKVLVRVDFNVPLDKNGVVTDDSRIRAALPTIKTLLEKKAKVILIAHLGRPKGERNPQFSLAPAAKRLGELLGSDVGFADDCVGPEAEKAVADLKEGQVVLLENLRFHKAETKADEAFGKSLASLADLFVQDAFGAVHRAHASTSVVPSLLESGAGALLQKELAFLSKIKDAPDRPFLAILGGAKVSDKIGVVDALIDKVDSLFIGGAMAYTFLKAKGVNIGASLLEEESIPVCQKAFEKAEKKGVKILLPEDHLVVKEIDQPEEAKTTEGQEIEQGWKGVDVGPKTIQSLQPILTGAKTIFWNGPSGIFEIEPYSKGTMRIAELAAETAQNGATVVVGGGDSVAAVKKAGVSQKVSYISTGGGASLEFLEGKTLPGVDALPNA